MSTPDAFPPPVFPPPPSPQRPGLATASLVLGLVALGLSPFPAGLFTIVCGVLAIIFGVRMRKRSRGFALAGTITGAVAILVAIVGVTVRMANDDERSWDAFQDDLVEEGLPAGEADCVVSRLQEDDVEVPHPDEAGTAAVLLSASLQCRGDIPGSTANCILEEEGERFGGAEASLRELAAAEASFGADDREAIAEASLRCQGASPEVAACVTRAMRREFGDDVFAARRLELSPEDQQRLATLTTECAEAG
jgi:hypothetical protein